MKPYIILSTFLFSVSAAFAGGDGSLLVGNGGDGLMFGKQLIVSDLLDAKGQKQVYVGIHIDPVFAKIETKELRGHSVGRLQLDEVVLKKKLTDLQELAPHFGEQILDVILLYEWSLTSQALPLLPNLKLETFGKERIQIAIRHQREIRISERAWGLLGPVDRVALVIHEAVYALLKPEPASSKEWAEQLAWKARFITRNSFVSPLSKKALLPAWYKWLSIQDFTPMAKPDEQLSIDISIVVPNGAPSVSLAHYRLPVPRRGAAVGMGMVAWACLALEELQGSSRHYVIRGERLPYEIQYQTYQAHFGQQVNIGVQSRNPNFKMEFAGYDMDYASCVSRINEVYNYRAKSTGIPGNLPSVQFLDILEILPEFRSSFDN